MLTNANSFFLLINIKNNAEYMKFHNIAVLITKNVRGVAISSGHNNVRACAGLRESERERERERRNQSATRPFITSCRRLDSTNHNGIWNFSFWAKLLCSHRPHVCNSLCISNLQKKVWHLINKVS